MWRGNLHVSVTAGEARYTSRSDDHIDLRHYGEDVRVGPGGDTGPGHPAGSGPPATPPASGA